jgi:hypothetical protein
VKGEGNQQDYGMRIYDPRIGKFLSVDPITKEYPELTPYQFASNKPINSVDLDGLEAKEVVSVFDKDGNEIVHREDDVKNRYGLGSGTLYHFVVLVPAKAEDVVPKVIAHDWQFLDVYIPNKKVVTSEKSVIQKAWDYLLGSHSGVEESMQEFGFQMYGNAPSKQAGAFDYKSNSKHREYLDMGLFMGVMGNLREFSGKQEIMDIGEDLLGQTLALYYLKSHDNLFDAFQAIKDFGMAVHDAIEVSKKPPTITITLPSKVGKWRGTVITTETGTPKPAQKSSDPDTFYVQPYTKP